MQGHTNRGSDSNLWAHPLRVFAGGQQARKHSRVPVRRGRRHGGSGQVLTQMESTSATPSRSRRVGMPDRPNVGTESTRTRVSTLAPSKRRTVLQTTQITSPPAQSSRSEPGASPWRAAEKTAADSAPERTTEVSSRPYRGGSRAHDICTDYFRAEARTVAARER